MDKRRRLLLGLACALTASQGVAAGGVEYRVSWFRIAGGGALSNAPGGAIGAQTTIGQSDADVVALCSADGGPGCLGASFEVSGGYWTGAVQGAGSAPGCGADPDCLFRDGFEP